MNKKIFFLQFTVIYTLMMIIFSILQYLIDFEQMPLLNIPALFGIAYWLFYTYSKKNARIMEGREKRDLLILAIFSHVTGAMLLSALSIYMGQITFLEALFGIVLLAPINLIIFLAASYAVNRNLVLQASEAK